MPCTIGRVTLSFALPSIASSREANTTRTVFHELAHWTGHESRLNRVQHSRFGDQSYAEEEFVAEIGSCFTLAALGVPQSDGPTNHKSYVANWLKP